MIGELPSALDAYAPASLLDGRLREPLSSDDLHALAASVAAAAREATFDVVYASPADQQAFVAAPMLAHGRGVALGTFGLSEGIVSCSAPRAGVRALALVVTVDDDEVAALARFLELHDASLVTIVRIRAASS